MKNVEKAAPDLYLIEHPFDGIFTGVAVIVGRGSVGVVDSGLETTPAEYIFPLLSELGLKPSIISLVVNSHDHGDHVWGNKALKERTQAKFAVHELDSSRVQGVDLKLGDGDTVTLGDRAFRVVHTPGHTSGSICLYDPVDRTLITGDSVQGRGVEEGQVGVAKANQEQYVRSMRRLLALEVRTLVMAHPYLPFRRAILTGDEPAQMIQESIRAVEARLR